MWKEEITKNAFLPEKDIIPDVHSHVSCVTGVNSHDVSIYDHHRPSTGGCYKVAMNLWKEVNKLINC